VSRIKIKAKTKKPHRYNSHGVKQAAVERMRLGCNVSELAAELKVSRASLYDWMHQSEARRDSEGTSVDAAQNRIRELEQRVSAQELLLGRQAMEISFFKAALRRNEESRQRKSGCGEQIFTKK